MDRTVSTKQCSLQKKGTKYKEYTSVCGNCNISKITSVKQENDNFLALNSNNKEKDIKDIIPEHLKELNPYNHYVRHVIIIVNIWQGKPGQVGMCATTVQKTPGRRTESETFLFLFMFYDK